MQTKKRNKGGFTLIELLVVALLIGILAAVALPQYQKAIEKARMTEGILAVEDIAKAQELYFLVHGKYTRDIRNLDIEYPLSPVTYDTIPSVISKNFLLRAGDSGKEQDRIADVHRIKNGDKNSAALYYSLQISIEKQRKCVLFSKASQFERSLCSQWADTVIDAQV